MRWLAFLLLALFPLAAQAQLICGDPGSGCTCIFYQGALTKWCPGAPWPPAPVTLPPASSRDQVLLVHVRLSTDLISTADTTAAMRNAADLIEQYSYGKRKLKVTATPWLKIAAAGTPVGCNNALIRSQAIAAAKTAGYVTDNYEFWVFVYSSNPGCAMRASAGGKREISVWGSRTSTFVYAHEPLHTPLGETWLGLPHDGEARCDRRVTPMQCVWFGGDYTDKLSVMSARVDAPRLGHPGAWGKVRLGWLTPEQVPTWSTGTQSYLLTPYETIGPGLKAVRIVGQYRIYWVEWRRDQLGATVRYEGCNSTCLVVYALLPGQVWTDGPLQISVDSLNADGLTLRVKS